MGKTRYKSDVVLGEKYRDTQPGVEGIADQIYFFQHGCERVNLQFVVDGKIQSETFDSPRLEHINTGRPVRTKRTGGDRPVTFTRPGP